MENKDNYSIDYLFNKINQLENENKFLIQQRDNLNLELHNKQLKKVESFWKDEPTKKEIQKFEESFQSSQIFYNNKIENNVKVNCVNHNFIYIPLDESIKSVFISGEFNDWNLSEMKKEKNKFIFNTYLKKGYNYLYCFFCEGLQLVDSNVRTLTKDKKKYNIISIPDEENKCIDAGDHFINDCKAEIIDGNEDIFIHNLISLLQKNIDKKYNLLNFKDKKISDIKNLFSNKIEELIAKDLVNSFNSKFIGRLIKDKSNCYYIIRGIKDMKYIMGVPMYDNNGIKVNFTQQIDNHLEEEFPIFKLFDKYNIVPNEEGKYIKSNWEKDTEHILKIFYVLQESNENREKLIIPYRISPMNINMSIYDIKIENDVIIKVLNKEKKCYIKYEDILIGNKFPNLVPSSKIIVYTTQEGKNIFKILHIHINDTSNDIAIDSEFLDENESILNHKIFEEDFMGKMLDYNIIFQKNKLVKIYYFISKDYIDEPDFTEIRFNQSTIARIIKGEYKGYLGKIAKFPEGMIVRNKNDDGLLKKASSLGYNKTGSCAERHFEELPGYLSFNIIFNSKNEKLDQPINISIPICYLSPLNVKEEIEIQKRMIFEETLKIQEKVNFVEDVYNICNKYKGENKLLENMSVEQLKEILEKLDPNVNWMEYNIEGENLEDKVDFIIKTIPELQRLIQQVLRFKAFQNK